MKIIVVSSSESTASTFKDNFEKLFIVDTVSSLHQAVFQATTTDYEAIIVQHLAEANDLTICELLRKKGVTAPILVLTLQHNPATMVELLNAGADDIVQYPCSQIEINAHISALSRRIQRAHKPNLLCVADLCINLDNLQVIRSGVPIQLRRKELEILIYMVKHKGVALSRERILSNAWNCDRENWHNTVDVHINYLRKKIDHPFEQSLIKTAYGVGYMIAES